MKKQPLSIKTFLASALFFIFTLTIVLAIFNYSMINYSENEIGASNIGKLKIIRGINDVLIYSIGEDAMNLSMDTTLTDFFTSLRGNNDTDITEKTLQFNNVIRKLNTIVNSNERIQSIYIYSKNDGYILSSKTGLDKINNFYDTDWLKYYKGDNFTSFWLPTRVPINKNIDNSSQQLDNSKVVSYVFPLSKYTTDLEGAVVINIYESKISELINNNNFSKEGYVFIVDKDGNIISHINKDLIGKSVSNTEAMNTILSNKKTEGYTISTLNDKRQLIAYYKSDVNNWYYIGVYPLNVLTSKANNLRFWIFIVIFLLMIVGVCVYYFATKLFFSPVNTLIQNIKKQKHLDFSENENEFAILSKAFDTIMKNENELSNSFEKSKKNIQNNFLFNLLNGNDAEIYDLSLYQKLFSYKDFICVILSIDKYSEFKNRFPDEQSYYIKTIILNISEQIFNESYNCSGIILDKNSIALIINGDISNYNQNIKTIQTKINSIISETSKVLDFSISFGISNKCSSKNELNNSYYEAQEALKYKFIYGYGSITNFNDISSKTKSYYFPYAFEEHIINNIDTLSKSGIDSEITSIIDKIRTDQNLSYDNAMLVFTQLISATIRHLLKMNISINDIFGNDFNIYNKLNQMENIDELSSWIMDVFSRIIDYLSSLKSSGDNYIDAIMKYITENYKRDIDINKMAEDIGISYTHLRRVFVNVTGENLVTYINNMRITEAKRMLKETNTSIVNIALSLGYNNDQSFNRFFKKYEGITAGEYRRINKKTPHTS